MLSQVKLLDSYSLFPKYFLANVYLFVFFFVFFFVFLLSTHMHGGSGMLTSTGNYIYCKGTKCLFMGGVGEGPSFENLPGSY